MQLDYLKKDGKPFSINVKNTEKGKIQVWLNAQSALSEIPSNSGAALDVSFQEFDSMEQAQNYILRYSEANELISVVRV